MNPTSFAMRRPITTLMLVVALMSGGAPGIQPDASGHLPPLHTDRKSTSFSITSA